MIPLKSEYPSMELGRPESELELAVSILKALRELDVKPGQTFVVMAGGEFDRMCQEVDSQVSVLESEAEDAITADGLLEAIEDFDRGILSREELIGRTRTGVW